MHVRADAHDMEGEQHRAREREQIAAPEREVGAGEEVEADRREARCRRTRTVTGVVGASHATITGVNTT